MINKFTKKEFKDTSIIDFKFDKISSEMIAKKVEESRMVIDIQHPKQTGLTMRTIEMFGMQKKLITTNLDIENYDFFDDRNVFIFNRNDRNIDLSKIGNEYILKSEEIYYNYSLEKWIYDVLGVME